MTRLNANEKQEKKQTLPTSAYFCREFLGGLQKDKCVASNIRYISVWSFKQWNDIRACGNNEMMTNMTISYPRPLGLLMDKLLEYEKWIQRENSLKKQKENNNNKVWANEISWHKKTTPCVCVYLCAGVFVMCVTRKERGHGVATFVAPWCNLDLRGWEVKGHLVLENTTEPKGRMSG